MITHLFKTNWQLIPIEVKRFLRISFVLFILWQLIYSFYLYPNRVLDDTLTRFTALCTESLLRFFYNQPFNTQYGLTDIVLEGTSIQTGSALISMGEQPLISIADPCNGLNMYALFVGFILAFPAGLGLKFRFGILGLASLIGVNVIRCVGLAALQIHHPSFTVFAHHYIFNVLTYAAVFGFWYWFTKKAA
jgi:exosortase/archaeosortase family protein